jgi:hypothetical protein
MVISSANTILLGAMTMALICQNCGNEKGNLAAYSSSCHPSSQYLNGMETTSSHTSAKESQKCL